MVHSCSLSVDPHVMPLNIDMKMIRPWNCSGSLIFFMNSWILSTCSVVNPGKYSTRIPSVLRQLCPKFCIAMILWTNSTVVHTQYLMLGTDSPFQDITQNLLGNNSWVGSKIHHNTELWAQWTRTDGIRVVYFHVAKVQGFMSKMSEPEQFQGRIIFMSMFNDISWGSTDNEQECIALHARDWWLLHLDQR